MAKRLKFDESGDSEDLQALFDSIAATPAKPRLEVVVEPTDSGDNAELQALFDSVSEQHAAPPAVAVDLPAEAASTACAAPAAEGGKIEHSYDAVFNRIGHMTRQLHDTLRELGYDRLLQDTAKAIPDARQRLVYIAQMTEQAASRVLNATDIAKPIQEELQGQAQTLSARWERAFRNELKVEEFKTLADDTRSYLAHVPKQTAATNAQLMEIMMAQDFQDLTGQVIKKVVDLAQDLETQMLQVLLETIPNDRKADAPDGLLNGPVVSTEGRTDVVSNQSQVDELLESLGF
jgi:chemotaxis protein CheZ